MARLVDSLPPAEPRGLLLVDDDRDFADSLAGLLRLEGYRVHVAYTFDTAVASADASGTRWR